MYQNGTNKAPATVVIVDDHQVVRHAVRHILESTGRYTVVGEGSTAEEAKRLVDEKNPALLLLDLGLPDRSGLDVVKDLESNSSERATLIFTMYEEAAKVQQALRAGARGYLLKTSSTKEILDAFDKVHAGETFIPQQFQPLTNDMGAPLQTGDFVVTSKAPTSGGAADPLKSLSKREREIFFFIADGIPNRVIAKKLFLSPRTVETHRARVIKKLGCTSTADLIRYALRNRLLSL